MAVRFPAYTLEETATITGDDRTITVVIDGELRRFVIHDGVTPGGHRIGDKGDVPAHQWDGTNVRFQNPDETWGEWIDLKSEAAGVQITLITAEGDTQVARVVTEGDAQELRVVTKGADTVALVDSKGVTQISLINQAGGSQVAAVNDAGTTQVYGIEAQGVTSTTSVTDEGVSQVAAVVAAGAAQVGNVTAEGTTQIGLVQAEVAAIETEGNTQVGRVTSEGTAQKTALTNQGNTEVARVTAEGDTQVSRVQEALGVDGLISEFDDKLLLKLDKTANAASASKLETARTIELSGDATGTVSFDGSGNVSMAVTVQDDSHNHTINSVEGLQTTIDTKADKESLNTLSRELLFWIGELMDYYGMIAGATPADTAETVLHTVAVGSYIPSAVLNICNLTANPVMYQVKVADKVVISDALNEISGTPQQISVSLGEGQDIKIKSSTGGALSFTLMGLEVSNA